MKTRIRIRKLILAGLLITFFFILGYCLPQSHKLLVPVKSVLFRIDPQSFWYYPWGESLVHKGVDVFVEKGTNVISPVYGIVLKTGTGSISGNYIYVLGPKWRIYYFAHLDTVYVRPFLTTRTGTVIGKVGNTGNAAGKPPHLHFSIFTVFPYVNRWDSRAIDGWKKIFYLDPLEYLDIGKDKLGR
ncbi:M23 family metallopeptidase [Sediminibacterium roseum]|uniref:M23 family metallopeptidase n=1 Tax=Sediminibacterium roseum TaxID=1978412 RepID=UPI00192A6C48|nr:M23 family metallopeptidase [Sediminibacterium roseum]